MDIARREAIPLCQDTGMACVFLALGQDARIVGGDLYEAVHEGIRQGYAQGYLRRSVVADPLRRKNTGDNTPALIHTDIVPGDRLTITLSPKGFGSENMSRLAMLTPAAGAAGVKDFVVETVSLAGPNPCPPIVVGVGIGGSFDQVALLAKKALLRGLDEPHPDPYYREMELELWEKINRLGIGPQGFGGQTTALGVSIETLPTHIAGLPVAVNISCHATRRVSVVL
jgi:fumarate hydratase subunit alpha